MEYYILTTQDYGEQSREYYRNNLKKEKRKKENMQVKLTYEHTLMGRNKNKITSED